MENDKKEKTAIIIGFFLILLVIAITLFRSKLFTENGATASEDSQNKQTLSVLGYQTINARDLQKKIMLAGKGGITLLDVRPFEAYAQEHLLDSINITPDEFPINHRIDAHNLVVIIGAKTDDSDIAKAVDELKKENYSDIMVLAGGMETWKQLVGVTVTYGNPKSFVDQSKVSYVEPEKLNDALKQNVPMFIVDVRGREDYNKNHIAGAINIPADELERRRGEITEKKVIVVGINELQEFQSSVQMYDMLIISPFVLKGAMPGWEKKGFPVVK